MDGSNRGGGLFLQERLLQGSHQILCRMMSPELIGLLSQTLEVGKVSPCKEDPQLPGALAQEEAGEDDALLCPSRANLQHGRHQLGRLPTTKSRHIEQSLCSLEVRELRSREQPSLQDCIRIHSRDRAFVSKL